MNDLNELLVEYRQTLKETRKLLANLEKKITIAQRDKNYKWLEMLANDKKIVNSWISNLQYSIQWLSTGKRPGSRRGIERRSVYQKEILVDSTEIARVIDSKQNSFLESVQDTEEELKHFEQVTNCILDVLTEKEQDIYKMHINGLAPFEIAKYMEMPYKTVYKTISRCKEKISNEDVSYL